MSLCPKFTLCELFRTTNFGFSSFCCTKQRFARVQRTVICRRTSVKFGTVGTNFLECCGHRAIKGLEIYCGFLHLHAFLGSLSGLAAKSQRICMCQRR
ncbi:hypothetical protein CDAR_93721 [Caerostris darwini]|uniref:Uncharacterized protein n=1 Tax=Caerostris darwini TaxID=1538125 RepID=A0AAV4NJQ5_9ARAC|nr:hypothetical protein CDAR_93721 [Caerostris darwini]